MATSGTGFQVSANTGVASICLCLRSHFHGCRFRNQHEPGEQIGRVRITRGNAALGAGVLDSNGNPNDLVVMDDFIVTDSIAAVPEPSTLLPIGPVPAGFALLRRRIAG